MKKDIEIANESKLEPIETIAKKAGIKDEYLIKYGNDKAKIDLAIKDELASKKDGKLILVTAINPTKAGEGKSTTTIGLVDGLALLNKNVIGCLREPSMGPVFGLKGGATGGGYAQVMPMVDINLHFTGDMHAITSANNLVSAVLDNSIYQGNPLNIDPEKVVFKRCLDMNDRTLRDVTIAQNKKSNGVERKDHFSITVATETMAVLCLAKDEKDFERRIGECVVAYTYDDKEVKIKDLGIVGSLSVLMRDALKPNLVQTLEHNPVLIHGGPFANIAHGCNSLIATKLGLKLADYVVTEAGFGSDLGAEKFLDIKCRIGELKPSVIVIVATCRSLKLNGGLSEDEIDSENLDALQKGIVNLEKHIDSMKHYGTPLCVAINRYLTDTPKEIAYLKDWCLSQGVEAVICEGYEKGGKGAMALGEKVIELCEEENHFKPLYPLNKKLTEKIETIAKEIYGAAKVEYTAEASEKLARFEKEGRGNYPICIAKTQNSLSDDPKLLGRPKDFSIHVKDVSLSNGAGFIVVYTGNILTMPGLPKHPNALDIGIKDNGEVYGIF